MIVFRYSKQNGAEFFSHLDTMRHIQKTLIRAGIEVKRSLGFAKRMNIFMSSPIGVGQQSVAEYCLVDTVDVEAKEFLEKFNVYAPKHIRCLSAVKVNKKCNLAGDIDNAEYKITGIKKFDVKEILDADTFTVLGKDGTEKQVRDKILDLCFDKDTLIARLASGNNTLRADYFADKLCSLYGGENIEIIKTQSFVKELTVEEFLEKYYV